MQFPISYHLLSQYIFLTLKKRKSRTITVCFSLELIVVLFTISAPVLSTWANNWEVKGTPGKPLGSYCLLRILDSDQPACLPRPPWFITQPHKAVLLAVG